MTEQAMSQFFEILLTVASGAGLVVVGHEIGFYRGTQRAARIARELFRLGGKQ